jgi:nucleotide-binding universal stress UspA family protein
MHYQKILVAVDGSEGSMNAVNHAMELAKHYEGEVTLVHVDNNKNPDVQPAFGMQYGRGYIGPGADTQLQPKTLTPEEQNQHIENEGEAVLKDVKANISTEVTELHEEILVGDPAKKICEFAELSDADLVVIGSRGLSGLKKLMLGSVSQKVTQDSPCPVLVIK